MLYFADKLYESMFFVTFPFWINKTEWKVTKYYFAYKLYESTFFCNISILNQQNWMESNEN